MPYRLKNGRAYTGPASAGTNETEKQKGNGIMKEKKLSEMLQEVIEEHNRRTDKSRMRMVKLSELAKARKQTYTHTAVDPVVTLVTRKGGSND